jgi:uncharacterized protein (UPF0332 family)
MRDAAVREAQIQAEWVRALKALRAAEALRGQGLPEDAISRAYYAVVHAAKAALLVHDAVVKQHRAVRRLFGHVLVKTGEIESEWAEVLAREQDQRGRADYKADFEVNDETTAELVTDARRFVERITLLHGHSSSRGGRLTCMPGGPSAERCEPGGRRGFQIADCGLQIWENGVRGVGSGLRITEIGLRTSLRSA